MRIICVALLLAGTTAHSSEFFRLAPSPSYLGMCDASGAVVVSSNRFLVANDEDNILRVYDAHVGGPPLQQFDLNEYLELEQGSPEADLEAAARVGNRVYWIASHGRNQDGKRRPNRCRFFATDIAVRDGLVSLAPVGRPCKNLLADLLREPGLKRYALERASQRTPKAPDALDIEGLAAGPDDSLLIGFRNPIPQGKALLVPLLNPNALLEGGRARFGPAIQLELLGLGVRDLTFCGQTYLIIAGPHDGTARFEFFLWGGPGKKPEKLDTKPVKLFNPEALLVYTPGQPREFQVLSDDGSRVIDGSTCKVLKDPLHRTFRSFTLTQE